MMPDFKRENMDYLGDSVYAGFDGFAVWIWTDNGMGKENVVCFEPEVQAALNRFRERQLSLQPKPT